MERTRRHLAGPVAAATLALVIATISGCARRNQAEIVVQLANVPSNLTVNQSVSLIATVGNDGSEAGVDWSCAGGACGTFAPAHTVSGAATVYTAPASSGPVTITAASTADAGAAASLTVRIVAADSNTLLNGAYVFSVQGVNGSGTYAAVGTLIADGNGHITGGQQDYTDESMQAGPDALTGDYAIGPDGRGSVVLNVANTSLPLSGNETFSLVLTSATHGSLMQFDGTANASGSLDAQAPSALDPAAISGAFAFLAQGVDIGPQAPFTCGGVLIMSALAGTVESGVYFENDGGFTFTSATTGAVTAPDAFGRGTLGLAVGRDFAYYAVQGQVLRIVGTDVPATVTGGSVYGQGTAGLDGTFSNASLAGDHVLSMGGGSTFGALALAGQFMADGAGGFSAGVSEVNNNGTVTFASIAGLTPYAISGNGVGTLILPAAADQRGSVSSLLVFLVDPALNLVDPASAAGGGGALVMDYDETAVASGYILPRLAGGLDGDYAVGFQYVHVDGQTDWLGQTALAAGALAGAVDINAGGLTTAGAGFAGTLAADAVNAGRWTGTLTVGGAAHPVTLYQVSGALSIILDTGTSEVGLGILERQ
jgi:hypothetical protein